MEAIAESDELSSTIAAGIAEQGAAHASLARMRLAFMRGSCTIMNIGHSVTEGASATGSGLRWTDKLRDSLRGLLGISGGGLNYFPATGGSYPALLPSNWTVTAGTANAGGSGEGVGRYARAMTTSSKLSLTFTGTSIRLFFTSYSGGPTVTVTIDGSPVASFSAASGSTSYVGSTTYSGLSAGSHTIELTNTGAQFNFQGAIVYNGDETSGVRVINAGHSGDQVSNIMGVSPLTRQTSLWTALAPDLVTIEYGINEYRNNTPVATFKTNLTNMVAALETAIGHSAIVIVIDYQATHATTPVAAWSAYKDAMREVAAENGLPVVDLSTISTLGIGQSGMNGDNIHPNDAGHLAIANLVSASLLAYV
ncbi:lysophospholipase L1-like esterase [Microbacterium trichothecenolyticum]|uniref:GDSL-type esterase/lipase family protein n=1 Tax=Microbacterium trichothecenolyticum TaxID=69370 RepID=UPI0028644122|nr:GDSL-type esterase/lipase family protein [Microbacterium trichothecenolyticum]MDR7113874.1 lysophospholipase L1-like esterase [Microbacterium trichothecenolyticum]